MLEICLIIVETFAKFVSVSLLKGILIDVNIFALSAGQLDEVNFFIFYLKSPSGTDCLISCDTKLQIFGPKWDRVSAPL